MTRRPLQRVVARNPHRVPSMRLNPCLKAPDEETSGCFWALDVGMKSEHESMATAVMEMDRRVIRVDVAPEHAGVMAALRRAFESAAREPSQHDFDALLRRLN